MAEEEPTDLKPCPLCTQDGVTKVDPDCGICHGAGVADTQAVYAHMEQLWIGIHKFAKESLSDLAAHTKPDVAASVDNSPEQ